MSFYDVIHLTYQVNSYKDTCFPNFFPKMNDQGRNLVSLKTQADAGSLVGGGHEIGIHFSPP